MHIKIGRIDINKIGLNLRHLTGEYNPQSRKVFVYHLNGEFIAKYVCIREAIESLNITNNSAATHIVQCCKGKRKTAYGYKWRYADE